MIAMMTLRPRTSGTTQGVSRSTENAPESSVTSGEPESRRYPTRERRKPSHLNDFITENCVSDAVHITVDYCCRAVCGIPQTFGEAMESDNSKEWAKAMDEEIQSLDENKTFTPTALPIGKETVGGRWVYAIKTDVDGRDKYKARFVAKGYSQRMGVDFGETFSHTADMTSIRVVLQKAAQENLLLHRMDVKTAYLINPPEGYEEKEGIVYKLEKSLYGLKQSGRNWNRVLHNCLTED